MPPASTGLFSAQAWRDPVRRQGFRELGRRLLFLLFALAIFRLGTHVPVPGLNPEEVARIFQGSKGTVVDMLSMFTGGALERMSIFALGIMPYISASIIVQLMATVIPSWEALRKEGESGRRKLTQYTRIGTLILAIAQGIGLCATMLAQNATLSTGMGFYVPALTSLVAGSMFLMWLGEQITERGVGNGVSMLIVGGIVARLPITIQQSFDAVQKGQTSAIALLLIGVLSLAVVMAVVFMEKAQRRIPVNYAQRQQGKQTYSRQQQGHLPLKINMAGVIPAIFASSLLLFPATLGQWVAKSTDPTGWQKFLQDVVLALSPGQPLYLVLFGALIIFFCYFYTALVFSPKEVAENLKRSGAYVPGIRPGEQTSRYLDHVLNRLTFIGSIYITLICLLPLLLEGVFRVPIHLGGTSVLIVVVVMIDFVAQMQTHLVSQQYYDQSLLKRGTSLAALPVNQDK